MSDHELLMAIYNNVTEMKADIVEMKADIKELQEGIETTNRIISSYIEKANSYNEARENEFYKDICIIAEGHSDLNRKFYEAMDTVVNKDYFKVIVNQMESQIKVLRAQLKNV